MYCSTSGCCLHYETRFTAPAQGLHRRIQPLLVFFIDAVNYLQDEETGAVDPRWEVYLAVRKQGEHSIVVRRCGSSEPNLSDGVSGYRCAAYRNARHKRVAFDR